MHQCLNIHLQQFTRHSDAHGILELLGTNHPAKTNHLSVGLTASRLLAKVNSFSSRMFCASYTAKEFFYFLQNIFGCSGEW